MLPAWFLMLAGAGGRRRVHSDPMRLLRMACSIALLIAAPALAMASPAIEETPWLGVAIVGGMHGVMVSEVIDDTPAAQGGLTIGDEILAVAGERVGTPGELIGAVDKHRIGEAVDLRIWRVGRVFEARVPLAAKPSEEEILHRRLVGKPAPIFDAPAVSGEHGTLAALRGRVVLLAFSAVECSACPGLHRRLSRLADRHADAGLSVLVLLRDARQVLEDWARSLAPSFTVLHDAGGAVTSAYRITQAPTVVLVDRDGAVVYAGLGSDDSLDAALLAAERALGLRRWL